MAFEFFRFGRFGVPPPPPAPPPPTPGPPGLGLSFPGRELRATTADATGARDSVAVTTLRGLKNYLTEVSLVTIPFELLRPDVDLAIAGPLYAELWLQRPEGLPILLARGFATNRAGARHGAVTGVGILEVQEGDRIIADVFNQSGAALTWEVRYRVAAPGVQLVPQWQDLSPVKEVLWQYRATIVNDGVTAGDHELRALPNIGNEFFIVVATVFNGDAAARSFVISLRNPDADIIADMRRAVVTIGAGGTEAWPINATAADVSIQGMLPVAGSVDYFAEVAAVAINENTAFTILAVCRGRPPTVTLTSPAGSTQTVTEDRWF